MRFSRTYNRAAKEERVRWRAREIRGSEAMSINVIQLIQSALTDGVVQQLGSRLRTAAGGDAEGVCHPCSGSGRRPDAKGSDAGRRAVAVRHDSLARGERAHCRTTAAIARQHRRREPARRRGASVARTRAGTPRRCPQRRGRHANRRAGARHACADRHRRRNGARRAQAAFPRKRAAMSASCPRCWVINCRSLRRI